MLQSVAQLLPSLDRPLQPAPTAQIKQHSGRVAEAVAGITSVPLSLQKIETEASPAQGRPSMPPEVQAAELLTKAVLVPNDCILATELSMALLP